MKRNLYTYLFVAVSALLMSGCKSAAKLYNQGRYEEVVAKAVKELQKRPDNREAQDLAKSAYTNLLQQKQQSIDNYARSNDAYKWERMAGEYQGLQHLYDKIIASPAAFRLVQPVNFSSELMDVRTKAADARMERGMAWLQYGDKENARRAYREFEVALAYNPGNTDIRNRMDEAWQRGVVNVVVMPVEVRDYQLRNEARDFEQNLGRYLSNNNNNSFVRFYSEWDARRRNIQPDQVIEMDFVNLNIGQRNTDNTQKNVYKDNVLLREVYVRPDSVVKEYGRVNATITVTRERIYAEGTLRCRIRDLSGTYAVFNERFTGSTNWTNEFGRFTGDERALSAEDRNLLKPGNNNPPTRDAQFEQITRTIYNDAANRIRDFYRHI